MHTTGDLTACMGGIKGEVQIGLGTRGQFSQHQLDLELHLTKIYF